MVDYDKVFDDPILGGQLSWTSNLTYLSRQENDPFLIPGNPTVFYQGLAGDYLRASGKLDWQREMVGPLGQMFVPFASVQGDVFTLDPTSSVPPALTDELGRWPRHPGSRARMELADPGDAGADLARVRADRADHRTAGRDARRQAAQQ